MRSVRAPSGLLFEYGEGRPASGIERETIGCGHCQTQKVIYEKSQNDWGVCYVCWRIVCGPCFAKAQCVPWEEMLAKQEAADASRRSMGL